MPSIILILYNFLNKNSIFRFNGLKHKKLIDVNYGVTIIVNQ